MDVAGYHRRYRLSVHHVHNRKRSESLLVHIRTKMPTTHRKKYDRK